MRLIKFALKNLLIVVAAVVLFSSISWAGKDIFAKVDKITCDGKAGANCLLVESCREQVNRINTLKKEEAEEAALVGGVGGAIAQGNEGEGAVKITDNTCGYSAFSGASSTKMVKSASVHYNSCMEKCRAKPIAKPEETDLTADQTKDKLEELRENICGGIKLFATSHAQGHSSEIGTCMAAKKARGSLLTKVAIGGAAIGGGLLVMDHINDKKDKKKEKKAEEEKYRADNGIIKDADGNDLQCFAQANFMKLECSEVMLGLCQGAKADTGGCRSFNSTYCASTGSGSNYCLYADAKTYCAQTGSVIAQSPACVWSGARSAECKKTPENVSCLYSGSAEALTLACQNFPNDPLCAAHSAGRIVVQGGNSAAETMAATMGDGTGDGAASGSSVSMASVIDSAQSSTSGSGAGSDSTTLSSNDSMWTSSSTVAQSACAEGLLQNCD